MASQSFDPAPGGGVRDRVYTVSELTREIKVTLEEGFLPIWVEGEISNFKAHPSGHLYFSLKDEHSQLRCVIFSSESSGVSFMPGDGMKVLARGSLKVYERGGFYELVISELRPVGVGELAIRFEALKKRLAEEGLFAPEHKLEIPEFPTSIGVVTSSSGAAIRDIVRVARRRFPGVEMVLKSTRVQGDGAASEIAQAIEDFNEYGGVDLIIVGRGGGSAEDLWAFNEEVVGRAIYDSEIPIISAVGHETDFTIADFVADLRAPTPSAAAEIALKERDELLGRVESLLSKASGILGERMASFRERLVGLLRSYGLRRAHDLVVQGHQTLDELNRRLHTGMTHGFQLAKEGLSSLGTRLEGANPTSILSRGYSICWKQPERALVNDSQLLDPQDRVLLKFFRGGAEAVVKKLMEEGDGKSEL